MPLNTEEGDHMGSRKGRRKSHLQKKKKWKRYYVLGLSKPRAGNCVKLGLEVTEKVIL